MANDSSRPRSPRTRDRVAGRVRGAERHAPADRRRALVDAGTHLRDARDGVARRRQRDASRSWRSTATLAVSWLRRAAGATRRPRASCASGSMTLSMDVGEPARACACSWPTTIRSCASSSSPCSPSWARDRGRGDGGEAWRLFEEWRPDLVVLDVDMPIVDGLEVCRRIRELDEEREVFVLFLAGRDHPEDARARCSTPAATSSSPSRRRRKICARGCIVARRRIAQDAARRRAEAGAGRRARWLSGIGEATLALQHEINNPLSALLGNAELMMMELEDRARRTSCSTSSTSRRCASPTSCAACDG